MFRPGTADHAPPGSPVLPNLGRRLSDLRRLAGPLSEVIGHAFLGLGPDALKWQVPTLQMMNEAGNVSSRAESEEDTIPIEDVRELAQVCGQDPQDGGSQAASAAV